MIEHKVSIIMSTYNEKIEWIEEAIESIINQTYKNIEFLIVIDNPNNKEIIERIKKYKLEDKRIKIIYNKVNIGLINSLNKALRMCSGEYIARMDADDICKIDRLRKQVELLDKNLKIDIVGSNIDTINEEGEVIGKNVLKNYNNINKIMKYKNIMAHPTLVFRKKVFDQIGGYNNALFAEDYELLIRSITNGFKIYMLNEALIYYRIRSNSITRVKLIEQIESTKYIQECYRSYIKNGIYKFDEYYLLNKLKCCDKNELSDMFNKKNVFSKLICRVKFLIKNPSYIYLLTLNQINIKLIDIFNF